jgi:DNA processing protein
VSRPGAPTSAWALGLAALARDLGRDLGRSARAAGGGRALWKAERAAFASALRLDGAALGRALEAREGFDAARALADLRAAGIGHVALGDQAYPLRLAELFDPPPGLFLRGAEEGALARLAEGPVVAVVGSRHATAGGLGHARALARQLAERDAVVVSGLARGVDAAAHEGALAADGTTVAVLGTGVDVVYPRRHRPLAERIRRRGLLVSEYWPGTPAAPWRFPARNRIIAGLAQAVVVVEAGQRSGALITADMALETGRAVLAMPGPAGAPGHAGCHALLRAGAALCESADDVVAELPQAGWGSGPSEAPPTPRGLEGRLYEELSREPLRADQLAAALAAAPAEVAAALARLEIDGHVLRGEGSRFWAAPRRGAA